MSISLDDLSELEPANISLEPATDRPLTSTEEKTDAVLKKHLSDLNKAKDPAKAAVLGGAIVEYHSTKQLRKMEDKSNDLISSIDLLLNLSSAASKLSADKPVINDDMRTALKQLKEKGIDLFPAEGKELDKESLMSLKSDIGSRMDNLRTEVQQIFTKMQTVIQNMASINDTVKKMITEQADLIRKMQDRSIKR